MQTTWEVLERAAGLIERDGWCQGAYCDSDGRHCLEGALFGAIRDAYGTGEENRATPNRYAAIDAVDSAIEGGHIPTWNDFPGRTQQEAVALIRAVAASEKARAQQTEPARESVPA